MSEIVCSKCGGIMEHKKGTNKSGKPYSGWFCTNKKECGHVEWTREDTPSIKKMYEKEIQKPATPVQPVVEKQEPKTETMSKQDWANKDASIAALALCKVKAVGGGYRALEGVCVENINEEIYNDYIFFLNRLIKE